MKPGPAQRRSRGRTLATDFARALERVDAARRGRQWPSSYYASRPLEFCRDVLGADLWSFQVQIVTKIARSRKTSIAGGRKVGKDFAVACACLWFWACFPRAKVLLYGPNLESIDGILYLEIRGIWRDHGRCLACKTAERAEEKRCREAGIDPPIPGPVPCAHSALMVGEIGLGCKTGLRAPDDRAILGMVANPGGGGLRGVSGEYMLSVVDEACEVSDENIDVIEGNLAAAHAKLALLANPTTTSGKMHASFHGETAAYVDEDGKSSCLTCASTENPNITEGASIPGLASIAWHEERLRVWGPDSRMYQSDVLGKWPKAEEGQLFPLALILQRETQWLETQSEIPVGRLSIGIDVAGEGKEGDATSIAVRRGSRILEKIESGYGWSTDVVRLKVLQKIAKWREPGDVDTNRPRVVVDADGREGERVFSNLLAYAQENYGVMLVTAFRGGAPPDNPTLKLTYRLNRDRLFGELVDWVRQGGCWPSDLKLRAQLDALRWVDTEQGKQVLIRKDDLRRILRGASPDEADSLALSCYMQGRAVEMPVAPVTPSNVAPFTPRNEETGRRQYLSEGYGLQRGGRRGNGYGS